MAISLSLVRAKLILFDPKADRRDFVCIAVSCGAFLVYGRLVEADLLNRSYLIGHSSEVDDDRTQSSTELRELAGLLLCPKHEDQLCEETARAWKTRRPDNDLFQLFELNRNPLDWICLAEHCHKRYDIRRGRVLTVMEALTFNEVAESRLGDEKREQLVKELVSLLHCDNHLHLDEIVRISNKWNKKVTKMIQRQESENSSCKEITPTKGNSKDTLNRDTTPQQHESEAEPVGRTSGKDLFNSQSGSVDSVQPNRGLFGSQSGSAGIGSSNEGLFGSKTGSGGFEKPSGGLFGFGGSRSSGGGLFGSKSGSGGFEKPSGGLFGSGGSGSSGGGLFESQSGSAGFGGPSRKGFSGSQSGSGGFGPSCGGSTSPQVNFSGFGSSNADSPTPRVYFGGFGSPNSSLTSKLVLDANPAPPSASQSGSVNSGLLSPNSSPPSSRKSPASTAEQTETASPGVKGPVVSTADDQARHPSSSRLTASPLSKPSPVDGAQGGSPVTNSLGHSLSAARKTAKPRSHSSSSIRVSGQQPQHDRPSQPRSTQSYPDLASESRNHGSDTERVVPIEISPISSSVEASENALFTAAYKKKFEYREIDIKLLRYIRSKTADNGKRVNSSSGDVYVLQNPAWPNHVKIGESGRDVDKRIGEIKRSCNIDSLEQVVDTEQKYFLNYKIVEKLCHEELKNFRKILLCESCKTKKGKQKSHEEWFQVKPEVAVRTVQKWRKWMSLSPYDGDGDLVPWWREKANDELFFKEEPFDVKEEAIDNHDSRHQRWSRWLKRPTFKERIDFEIERFFLHTRPKRKSVWNRAEENLVPLLIYFFVAFFICGPRNWILLVLIHLLAF